jgi:AcrR family transcriptional regulator
MQVLKAQVRNRILNAAKKEFLRAGYSQASMRFMAEQSDITVGNIYRYFSSKQALFDEVVHEVNLKLREMLLAVNFEGDSALTHEMYMNFKRHFVGEMVKVIAEHRDEILILINGAAGTAYETAAEAYTTIIDEKLDAYVFRFIETKHSKQDLAILSRIISKGIIEAINDVISRSDSLEKEAIKSEINMIIDFYFSHIVTRFEL